MDKLTSRERTNNDTGRKARAAQQFTAPGCTDAGFPRAGVS